jgi:hypothetical protein
MPNPVTAFCALLAACTPVEASTWFDAERQAIEHGDARARLLVAFAAAGRRVGAAPLPTHTPLPIGVETWSTGDLARVALLCIALECIPEGEHVALVEDLYFRGELGEKCAVLRALPLLPNPGVHLDVAREACRTNAVSLFEAIATDNPYPERYFSELAYNQLVMKALFLGVSARRILGVEGRVGAELLRMLHDYRDERIAAGRSVPEDLEWLAARAR